MHHIVEVDLGGRKITLETGKMAKQAGGAVVVRSGDAVVLVTACMADQPKVGAGFFPLTVDYREYTYSAGKIPGGFIKREGRPSEKEVLTSRLIDRPIRPLFPEGFLHETQIIAMVLYQDFIVLNLFEVESWRAVAHDFAGMLLNYNYPPAQGWFDEGLAEYFSSIRVDNKQVELGSDPELLPSATQDLLGNQRETHPPKSFTELLGAQVWLSLPDLFTMKHDTSSRNEGNRHTLYYAESWIVMHYLLHEQKLPETGAYFDLVLNQHVPVEDAIQKAYGMNSAQLEQAVKDYFHSQTALLAAVDATRQTNSNPASAANPTPGQAYRFPVPVAPEDSAITSKPLPEADARALYFEVAIRVPERRDLGLQELHALATAPTAADKKF